MYSEKFKICSKMIEKSESFFHIGKEGKTPKKEKLPIQNKKFHVDLKI